MKKEIINVEYAIEKKHLEELKVNGYILYYIDKVNVGRDIEEITLENLLEGRIFGEENEIRILREKSELKAILLKDEDSDKENIIKTKHLVIDNKFTDIKKVGIKKYLSEDKDGQVYIEYWRPYMLE